LSRELGAKDEMAPISETEDMVKTLKALGNDVRFSVLPDRDHYILDVYEESGTLFMVFAAPAK
jgi:dipeptidyl aminopeptidase/acylaminoacyl peptidase